MSGLKKGLLKNFIESTSSLSLKALKGGLKK